jgi:hypothetical protein
VEPPGGRLRAHELVHVPVDTAYNLTAREGPALVIVFRLPGRGA